MKKIKQVKGIRHDQAGRRLPLIRALRKIHAERSLEQDLSSCENLGS